MPNSVQNEQGITYKCLQNSGWKPETIGPRNILTVYIQTNLNEFLLYHLL